jgi:hypothetical protein
MIQLLGRFARLSTVRQSSAELPLISAFSAFQPALHHYLLRVEKQAGQGASLAPNVLTNVFCRALFLFPGKFTGRGSPGFRLVRRGF